MKLPNVRTGPTNLITDVAGIEVGHAVDTDIRTGCTVVKPAKPAVCAVDVRGGAAGVQLSELIEPGSFRNTVDAISLSGGSLYGLGAASGVAAALGSRGIGSGLNGMVVPIVPGAIIFDLMAQNHQDWYATPPYQRLGTEAVENLSTEMAIGSVGAGLSASACEYAGGLGSASVTTDDGLVVGALAVVNSLGSVAIPGEKAFWAFPYERDAEFGGYGGPKAAAPVDPVLTLPPALREPGQATTLVVVATNAKLDKGQAKRLAVMAQAGMARAIRPVHTLFDGDVVFAMATDEVDVVDPIHQMLLGSMAADCVARAIARAVYHAGPHPNLPHWQQAHPAG